MVILIFFVYSIKDMAAGKMFLAAKAGRRRRYKRRASGFKKAVSSIAKRVVMRQSETKTASVGWTTNFGTNGAWYTVNGGGIWSSIVQGDAQNNRDGDTVRSLGVKIRGRINIDSNTFTGLREYASYRMLICTGKRPLTSGDMPSYQGTIDPEVLTVLSDTYHKLSNDSFINPVNKYVKFSRLVRYNGLVAIKNDLHVFIIPVPIGTGLTTTAGYGLQIEFQPYFKDI